MGVYSIFLSLAAAVTHGRGVAAERVCIARLVRGSSCGSRNQLRAELRFESRTIAMQLKLIFVPK